MSVSFNRNNGTLAENSVVAREKLVIGGTRLSSIKGTLTIEAPVDVKALTIDGQSIQHTAVISSDYITGGYNKFQQVHNLIESSTHVVYQYQDIDLGGCILHNMGLSIELEPNAVINFGKIGLVIKSSYIEKYPLPDSFIGKRTVGCEAVTNANAIIGTWYMEKNALVFEAELVQPNKGSLVFAECMFAWTTLKK